MSTLAALSDNRLLGLYNSYQVQVEGTFYEKLFSLMRESKNPKRSFLDSKSRKGQLNVEGFPFDKISPKLIDEVLSIPLSKDWVCNLSAAILARILLARTVCHQLTPNTAAWQEIEELVDELKTNDTIIKNALSYCLRESDAIKEFAYCFSVLLKMYLKIDSPLHDLKKPDAGLNDEIQK